MKAVAWHGKRDVRVDGFHTHRLPLADAPHGYEIFQKKEQDAIKVLLEP